MVPPSFLRRLGAPLVTNKLADPADNAPGHISDRLSVTTDAEPAPTVAITPCPTVGAIINTPVHEESF